MLRMIVDSQFLVIVLGVLAFVGVGSKCVVNILLKRLMRAAGNMNKSNHSLMRLMRAKFEHACMVSEKVENVEVFVDKYMHEYKVFGMRLHSLRRMEKAAALLCVVTGLLGAGAAYSVHGMNDLVLQTGVTGAGLGILVYVFHLTTDENYRLQVARNYMVDYLQNVCLHKYEKVHQREAEAEKLAQEMRMRQEPEEREYEQEEYERPEEVDEEQFEEAVMGAEIIRFEEQQVPEEEPEEIRGGYTAAVTEEKEEKPEEPVEKGVLIRQILEEFMA